MNEPAAAHGSSLVELLQTLRDASATLFRKEVQLAKAELGEKATEVGEQALKLAIGALCAFAGLIVLLIGLGHLGTVGLVHAGMNEPMATWLAPVLVGLLVVIIGAAMLANAKKNLRPQELKPTQTLGSLEDNTRWAKNKLQDAHESIT